MATGKIRKAAALGRVRKPVYIWRKLVPAATVNIDGFTVEARPAIIGRQAAKLLRTGLYEEGERFLAKTAIRADDRVLEAGGGLGIVTMTIARIVGPDNIVVYEASPATAMILESNLLRNRLPVEVRRRALSNVSGNERFAHCENILASGSADVVGGDGQDVPSDSVTAVVESFAPTVLVLDVEGKEIDIICGSNLWGVRAVVVEIHPRLCGDQAYVPFYRHLFDLGFVLRHALSFDAVLLFERA